MASIAKKPGTLNIQETFICEEPDGKSYLLGEPSDYYEPFTDDLGRLFKSLRREYGRCVGKVYQDTPDGQPDAIGWVFQKRMEYEDARPSWSKEERTYTREVWVTYRWV